MGMFDNVTANDLLCRKCDEPLDGFQSKDGPQNLDTYTVREFLTVTDRKEPHIYTVCDGCGTWNEFAIGTYCKLVDNSFRVRRNS